MVIVLRNFKNDLTCDQMYQLSTLFMIKYQKENLTFKCTLWTVHHLVVLENNFQIASHCQRIFCIARDRKGKTSFYDQFRFKNDRKFSYLRNILIKSSLFPSYEFLVLYSHTKVINLNFLPFPQGLLQIIV